MSQDEKRDDELLDMEMLLAEGVDSVDARAALGPHAALPRCAIAERLEMRRLERKWANRRSVDVWGDSR